VSATPTELVERFYNVVWNEADETEASKILDANFRFRASLGPELRGPGGFIAYMRSVHAALANFVCTIEEIIATEDRAAARMSFRGAHRAKFFGVEPTGQEIR
jgi:predicted ester cyclase